MYGWQGEVADKNRAGPICHLVPCRAFALFYLTEVISQLFLFGGPAVLEVLNYLVPVQVADGVLS